MVFSIAWPREAVQDGQDDGQARGVLPAFRCGLFGCFGTYRDTLSRCAMRWCAGRTRAYGCGAVARAGVPPRARRGVQALNRGRVQIARLRWALAALPLPPGTMGGSGWRWM